MLYVLGGRRFLPQAPRSYPIPMAHRVTPGKPEVTPGTKSYWHTGTTQSLVWQTKHVKCVRAIANFIFNTISFGDKTMLKVGNRHWHTRIDSKTAAFHPNVKSNQFCSTRPVFLSWLMTLDMDSFVFGTLTIFFPMAHLVPSKSCKASPS